MTTLGKYSPPLAVIVTSATALAIGGLYFFASGTGSEQGHFIDYVTQAQRWESLEIEPNGLVVRNVYNLFPIATLLALTFLCFVGVAHGVLRLWMAFEGSPLGKETPSNQLIAAGYKIEKELSAILGVLSTHFESNENYTRSLAHAQRSLTSMPKPEQVRTIITVLIAENEKMQRESNELKSKLEQSRSQIENLRSNLSEAEAIGMLDPLTSVGNRRCFDATLAKEVSDAHERRTAMSLVMGDIDNFKKVNDTHGHLAGDEILKVFARVLSDNATGRDTVARFGGEEFAIILPETDVDSAATLAERMRLQFESKRLTNTRTQEKLGKLTASFGVAQLRDGDGPDAIVQRADAKLYEAKCNGRNRVAVYGRIDD